MCIPFLCQNSTLIVNLTFDNIQLLIEERISILSKMFLLFISSLLSRIQQKKSRGRDIFGLCFVNIVRFSGKQITARKMADQLKNCINQRAHGFYSNLIHTAGSVWITDIVTNVMIHYNTSRQKCCAWQEIKVEDNCWNSLNDQSSRKETKLLEAVYSVIKARLNGFSPFL